MCLRQYLINDVINAIGFRLECVVNALCRGLSHASGSLSRLVLDMNLSGEQVSRVCEALRGCIQVQALHLPHLGCGCEGLASVAELLKERPLLALNLAGSWGAKNEDPSSSGISMGKILLLLLSIRRRDSADTFENQRSLLSIRITLHRCWICHHFRINEYFMKHSRYVYLRSRSLLLRYVAFICNYFSLEKYWDVFCF